MWQATGEIRYRKIWLENDCLKADGAYDFIFPFRKPDLPYAFAKVNDAKSALIFERKYAPLGYDSLLANPKKGKGGDPVEWVLEHARFVRFALGLTQTLAMEYGRGTIRLLRDVVKYEDVNLPNLQRAGDLTYPSGVTKISTIVPAPKSESDALWSIPSIIALLVNANTKNIHQKLDISHKGRIIPLQMYHALIEAIWSMVGDLAIKAQQEKEKESFKICGWCGSPFWATHKRRKFCPPIFGKESLCGLKYRQHKFQAKKGK